MHRIILYALLKTAFFAKIKLWNSLITIQKIWLIQEPHPLLIVLIVPSRALFFDASPARIALVIFFGMFICIFLCGLLGCVAIAAVPAFEAMKAVCANGEVRFFGRAGSCFGVIA